VPISPDIGRAAVPISDHIFEIAKTGVICKVIAETGVICKVLYCKNRRDLQSKSGKDDKQGSNCLTVRIFK
jgi:hypothetical protein